MKFRLTIKNDGRIRIEEKFLFWWHSVALPSFNTAHEALIAAQGLYDFEYIGKDDPVFTAPEQVPQLQIAPLLQEEVLQPLKEIYNNGALKIIHHNNGACEFGIYFNCAGVKKSLFITEEQFEAMRAAKPEAIEVL